MRIPKLISVTAVVALLLAWTALLSVGPAQAQGTGTAHPAHIHRGSCAELDPNPQYPLNDVADWSAMATPTAGYTMQGLASAVITQVSSTNISVSLDDLLAGPHALNVHESAQNVNNYIACGDLGGMIVNGTLAVGLLPQNDSGFTGVAILQRLDGQTRVDVYLYNLTPPPVSASPVATPAPVGQATQTMPAGGATPAAGGETGGGQPVTEATIDMVDIAFDPTEVTIAANTDVTITLPNNGLAVHNFNVDAKNNPSDPAIHSGDVPAGESTTVTVNLPPGDWYFYCSIPGHEEAGMHGILHVM
jgi:plastocyanin